MKPSKKGTLAEDIDRIEDRGGVDDVTRKKIKKHLSDINDEISEQDIKNVKIPGKDLEVKNDQEGKLPTDKEKKDKDDESSLTTWNVLEE